ncbi:MAG TPA: hypothetical protein VMM80_01860 [Bacteroidota bacterium]|nr:hypothetical protein [Bacteroidota bacterium]
MDYRLVSIGLFALLAGCSGNGSERDDARLARALASLVESSQRSAGAVEDSARVRARVDSSLAGAGMTEGEFRASLRALNDDPARWRAVSEGAAKLIEQRIAAR